MNLKSPLLIIAGSDWFLICIELSAVESMSPMNVIFQK